MKWQQWCVGFLVATWSLGSSAKAQERYCLVEARLDSRHRRVYAGATISVECQGSVHSPPFGNWGVENQFFDKKNGNQFRGWHPQGEQRQWNSCTTDERFDQDYNFDERDGRMTAQKADPDDIQEVGRWSFPATVVGSCGTLRSVPVRNLYMDIYELDPVWPDAHIATLRYPPLDIELSCPSGDRWECSGQSEWVWPVVVGPPSSRVDAQVRVTIRTTRASR